METRDDIKIKRVGSCFKMLSLDCPESIFSRKIAAFLSSFLLLFFNTGIVGLFKRRGEFSFLFSETVLVEEREKALSVSPLFHLFHSLPPPPPL